MNYWPLSMIAQSPLCQHPGFLQELAQVYVTGSMSPAAFETCGYIAQHTTPVNSPSLVIIETIEAPTRFAYVRHPSDDEWLRLERGGIVDRYDGTLAVMFDGLH